MTYNFEKRLDGQCSRMISLSASEEEVHTVPDPEPSLSVVPYVMVKFLWMLAARGPGLYIPGFMITSLEPVSINRVRFVESPISKLPNQKR